MGSQPQFLQAVVIDEPSGCQTSAMEFYVPFLLKFVYFSLSEHEMAHVGFCLVWWIPSGGHDFELDREENVFVMKRWKVGGSDEN